ncbi:MAG: damage-inducible protein CinA [Alteromonadaceae bacterium]|nr:MAG: damage-inducible protein CinA [Alteromonadaceae bacterium]
MTGNIYLIAEQLGKQLKQQSLTVTTAESCTGGGISQTITAIPGSSEWFQAAFVVYSNAMKIQILQVDPVLIDTQGAVSLDVVKAMLQGALSTAKADVGIAVSGIAGPGGGTPDKPVGTVCIAYGSQENSHAEQKYFPGDRQSIREQVIQYSLQQLSNMCRCDVTGMSAALN